MTDREHIKQQLQEKLVAYQQLLAGSRSLLEQNTLYWTEKLLLSLLRALSARRIEQLLGVLPLFQPREGISGELKESMVESMIKAALGGHDLGPWDEDENGYQARCLLCDMTTWLGPDGLRYSLLEDECTTEIDEEPNFGDGYPGLCLLSIHLQTNIECTLSTGTLLGRPSDLVWVRC